MPGKRLPKAVVARAKALARPEKSERAPAAPAEKPAHTSKADASVRAKLVAHLKRLHPMD
jgi:hypothetical protein